MGVFGGVQKGAKGKGKAAKGGAEEGVDLTPEEQLAKAKLRIEALERELRTLPPQTNVRRCHSSPGAPTLHAQVAEGL